MSNRTSTRQGQISKSLVVNDLIQVPVPSYSSLQTLEDDLNYLRSIIKTLKGTDNYDSPLSSTLEALYSGLQNVEFEDAILTGTPTAPAIIPTGDYSDRVATTLFVTDAIAAAVSASGNDARYVHVQNALPPQVSIEVDGVFSNWYLWYVEHNLGKFPSVTIINSADQVVIGLVEYKDSLGTPSQNALKIYLKSNELGRAFLN